MDYQDILSKIAQLEREISFLPQGSITTKKIHNKEYYYHRIVKDGNRTENYVSSDSVEQLREAILKRRTLVKELKKLKQSINYDEIKSREGSESVESRNIIFKTIVRTGRLLSAQIEKSRHFKKRNCFSKLRDYIFNDTSSKVFILYGLRRTGKTTMMYQLLSELDDTEFQKAAFIQVGAQDSVSDLFDDIKILEKEGFKYVFIDEVTLMEDFIENAAVLSDIYAASGMKIVLSGTDSLGFAFTKEEQLYDRCIMVHTTFIPYREFEEVLGLKGIDEYIRYGGTMSLSGLNYNTEATFANERTTQEYIDTAIARNIQHSLKMYEYGGHFRMLLDLYEKGELTNVINRVVENINHSFTKQVIEKSFKSHDISVTAANLYRDRFNPINIKEHIDIPNVTKEMMDILDILNKEEQTIEIEETHLLQIKEYLTLLDLIMDIDIEALPDVNAKRTMTVIMQPGMRYAQAKVIVEKLLLDEKFIALLPEDRQHIIDRLLSEVRGRMMEEIILLETKIAKPNKKVFKLQFAVGEFDMVVYDKKSLTCEIYEVKYSTELVPEQARHLNDEEKCDMTEHRYGKITGKYVIYRGDSTDFNGVQYLNVEEYLKSL